MINDVDKEVQLIEACVTASKVMGGDQANLKTLAQVAIDAIKRVQILNRDSSKRVLSR